MFKQKCYPLVMQYQKEGKKHGIPKPAIWHNFNIWLPFGEIKEIKWYALKGTEEIQVFKDNKGCAFTYTKTPEIIFSTKDSKREEEMRSA